MMAPCPQAPAAPVPRAARSDLERLVDHFYADVLRDPELGPLFAAVAGERWPEHRARMTDFWCTTLLHTRSFRGNVMRKHLALLPRLRPEHFERRLTLWHRHTVDQLSAADAHELFETARGIARNLHLGCYGSAPRIQETGGVVRLLPA